MNVIDAADKWGRALERLMEINMFQEELLLSLFEDLLIKEMSRIEKWSLAYKWDSEKGWIINPIHAWLDEI